MNATATHRSPDTIDEGGWTRQWRRTWHHDSALGNYLEVAVWRYFCEMAEHQDRQRRSPGKHPIEVSVPRGGLLFTVLDLARGFETSRKRIDTILRRLVAANRVEICPVDGGHIDRTSTVHRGRQHGMMLKVLNYQIYQGSEDDQLSSTEPPQNIDGSNSLKQGNKELKEEQEERKEARKEARKTDPPPLGGTRERAPAREGPPKEATAAGAAITEAGDGVPANGTALIAFPDSQRKRPAPGDEFERWWSCWSLPGTKRGKGQARKAYDRRRRDGLAARELEEALDRYMTWCERQGIETGHICHPTTWLNGERWTDDLSVDLDTRAGGDWADRFIAESDRRATEHMNGAGS